MPMTTATVTGTLKGPDGAVLAGATIRAEVSRWGFAAGNAIAVPGAVEVQTNAQGQYSFPVWTTDSTANPPSYTISIRHQGAKQAVFRGIRIPDGLQTADLFELLGGLEDTGDAVVGKGLSVMTWALPGETPAAHGTVILERALASTSTDLFVPAGVELVVAAPNSTQARLIGKSLRGPGTIRFTVGNLRLGPGAKACSDLRIRGTGKTNAGSGISVLSGSSDVLVQQCDIADVSHNGVNINGGTSDVRVLGNRIRNCGGGSFNVTYQGCGIYASGQTSAITGLRIAGNDVAETYGIGAVMAQSVTGVRVDANDIARTAYRGIYLTGTNTGRVKGNSIQECGELNATGSGVGCNGIMVNLTVLASDVLVDGNWIYKVAENGFEGRALFLGNTVIWTGAYPGLPTPSTEGGFITPESTAEGNTIYRAGGHGIYCFADGVSKAGLRIVGNTIVEPLLAGVRVIAKAATLSDALVARNEVWGRNNAAERGVEVALHETAPGVFSDVRVVANEVFGRALNPIHSTVTARWNSWSAA